MLTLIRPETSIEDRDVALQAVTAAMPSEMFRDQVLGTVLGSLASRLLHGPVPGRRGDDVDQIPGVAGRLDLTGEREEECCMDRSLVPFALFVPALAVGASRVLPWPVALVVAELGVACAVGVWWVISGWLVPLLYRARPLQQVYPELAEVLAREITSFAQQTGIWPPHIYLVESPFAGAYGVGGGRAGAIMVTTALLEHLSYHEVRALLAHEVAHLREGDTVMLAASAALTTVVKVTARVLAGVGIALPLMILYGVGVLTGARRQVVVARRVLRQVPPYVDALVARSVSLLMAWASRDAEFAADRLGAQLAGQDHMMIAVAKLPCVNRIPAVDWLGRLFDYHPTTEDRIEALLALAPLPGESV